MWAPCPEELQHSLIQRLMVSPRWQLLLPLFLLLHLLFKVPRFHMKAVLHHQPRQEKQLAQHNQMEI
jgi:hypothetical protein